MNACKRAQDGGTNLPASFTRLGWVFICIHLSQGQYSKDKYSKRSLRRKGMKGKRMQTQSSQQQTMQQGQGQRHDR
jgi:hypothetical protein